MIRETIRGVVWELEPTSCTSAMVTLRAMDHYVPMAASLLDFSLWDATCAKLNHTLSEASIEALKPWLRAKGSRWRIGWKRKPPKPKAPKQKPIDPRQLKLRGLE